MNAQELQNLTPQIKAVLADLGFELVKLWSLRDTFAFDYRRASGPTIMDELRPQYTSKRGRLDFTTCHTHASKVEKEEKQLIKKTLREKIPACAKLGTIYGNYADHVEKIKPCLDGYALNN
jgi:hypothetical protein